MGFAVEAGECDHIVWPMPLPEQVRFVGWILLGYATIVALLYAVAIAAGLVGGARASPLP